MQGNRTNVKIYNLRKLLKLKIYIYMYLELNIEWLHQEPDNSNLE